MNYTTPNAACLVETVAVKAKNETQPIESNLTEACFVHSTEDCQSTLKSHFTEGGYAHFTEDGYAHFTLH